MSALPNRLGCVEGSERRTFSRRGEGGHKREEFKKVAIGMALVVFMAMPCATYPEPLQDQGKEAERQQEKRQSTKLHIRVTGGEDATPVPAAEVDVTSEEEGVDYHGTGRTDHRGVVDLEVPRGKVLIQVTAPHWDTGGKRLNMRKEEETTEINLKRET